MDKGAWRATVHGDTKSWARLSDEQQAQFYWQQGSAKQRRSPRRIQVGKKLRTRYKAAVPDGPSGNAFNETCIVQGVDFQSSVNKQQLKLMLEMMGETKKYTYICVGQKVHFGFSTRSYKRPKCNFWLIQLFQEPRKLPDPMWEKSWWRGTSPIT